MDQRDGHRLALFLGDLLRHLLDRAFIEGQTDLAFNVDALGHREAQPPRHQHLRLLDRQVVLVKAALVGNFDDVSKAVGRDQRRLGALALDDGVGRERRAVHDLLEIGKTDSGFVEHTTRALENGALGRIGRGQHLGRVAFVPEIDNDVSERAAHVDSETGGRVWRGHGVAGSGCSSDLTARLADTGPAATNKIGHQQDRRRQAHSALMWRRRRTTAAEQCSTAAHRVRGFLLPAQFDKKPNGFQPASSLVFFTRCGRSFLGVAGSAVATDAARLTGLPDRAEATRASLP